MHLPSFFRYGIADEVHEAKSADTAQGNALGKLAAAVDKLIVPTGTLTGGVASDVFRILYGFRPFRVLELALYHSLGKLPEPRFFLTSRR